jgi:hypothetical protein
MLSRAEGLFEGLAVGGVTPDGGEAVGRLLRTAEGDHGGLEPARAVPERPGKLDRGRGVRSDGLPEGGQERVGDLRRPERVKRFAHGVSR